MQIYTRQVSLLMCQAQNNHSSNTHIALPDFGATHILVVVNTRHTTMLQVFHAVDNPLDALQCFYTKLLILSIAH